MKEEVKSQKYLKSKLDVIERSLRKGEIHSMQSFNKELRNLQEQFYSKFPNFGNKTNIDIWRSMTEKIVFKAGDYISRIISDKAKQETTLLKAQLENVRSSHNKLTSELDHERAKKAKDIREVEKKNATLKSAIRIIEEKYSMTEKNKSEENDQLKQKIEENEVFKKFF